MIGYRLVARNYDKPHRCPECHGICWTGSRRLAWVTFPYCTGCDVQWWLGGSPVRAWGRQARWRLREWKRNFLRRF